MILRNHKGPTLIMKLTKVSNIRMQVDTVITTKVVRKR